MIQSSIFFKSLLGERELNLTDFEKEEYKEDTVWTNNHSKCPFNRESRFLGCGMNPLYKLQNESQDLLTVMFCVSSGMRLSQSGYSVSIQKDFLVSISHNKWPECWRRGYRNPEY